VWVISADGTLEPGLPIDPATLDKVRLFRGTEGAPVLWTGKHWLRWQPWFAAFQPIPDAPANGPGGPAIANGDSGLALWLDDRIEGQLYVTGYRFATRSRYGAVRNPLLLDSTLGLAPDRVTGTPGSSIRFDEATGLELGPGASAFVTDLSYADVSVELDTSGAPAIVLRQEDGRELSVGGAECPFAQAPIVRLRVDRTGTQVRYGINGGDSRLCTTELTEGARVSIGVRGSDNAGASFVRNLRIVRR
jgi:hypothetical protein